MHRPYYVHAGFHLAIDSSASSAQSEATRSSDSDSDESIVEPGPGGKGWRMSSKGWREPCFVSAHTN